MLQDMQIWRKLSMGSRWKASHRLAMSWLALQPLWPASRSLYQSRAQTPLAPQAMLSRNFSPAAFCTSSQLCVRELADPAVRHGCNVRAAANQTHRQIYHQLPAAILVALCRLQA